MTPRSTGAGRSAASGLRSAAYRAIQGFFRRVKAGEKPGHPRFKGRGWWDSIEWPEKGGARWDSVPHPTVTRVYLKGIGHVRVHQHRAVKGRVKTITAKREAGRWYLATTTGRLAAAQQDLSRKKRGSKRRRNILRAGLALQEAQKAT
jgi:hypothetical protein